MPCWRLFYHLIWATRGRVPVLEGEAARMAERSIRATAHEQSVLVHTVRIMPDHVHVAVSIPPSLAVAAFVGRLKGTASHLLNHANGRTDPGAFAWQAEYGAFSFGEKALPDVVAYVENQPARHATNRLWPALERWAEPSKPQPASAGFVG